MAHNEHNRQKRGGGFALIILGALLLFLAPNIYGQFSELATASLIGGFVIGGIGFYLNFFKKQTNK